MSIRRRSTVHDLTSLRLHPDGSRVQISQGGSSSGASSQVAKKTTINRNKSLRLSKSTVQDAHGNWIARDAGGNGTVESRRNKKIGDRVEAGEWYDLDTTSVGEEGDRGNDSVDNVRALKRKKFAHDFLSFLDSGREQSNSTLRSATAGSSSHVDSGIDHSTDIALPPPSSEFLKFIHYFASEYYSATGHLYNAAKEVRLERKRRILARLKMAAQKRVLPQDLQPHVRDMDLDSSDDHSSEESEIQSVAPADKSPRKGGSKREKNIDLSQPKDMYKALDGSALMAIGILLQEQIAEVMTSDPSSEWEEAMLAQFEREQTAENNPKRGRKQRRVKRFVQTQDNVVEDASESESH